MLADAQATTPRSEAYSDYKGWSENDHIPILGNRRFVEELKPELNSKREKGACNPLILLIRSLDFSKT